MTQLPEVLTEPIGDRELTAQQLAALNAANVGFAQLVGLEITHASGALLAGRVGVGEQHLQVAGIVNGGVFAAIGETLGSAAAILTAGAPAIGMSNNTDLLRSVTGGTIEAEARPVHIGRRTHLWRIEMRNDGALAAVTNLKLLIP
ncbi:PaaI family thioesterase [Corynebacterium sp. Q4381]|uniref:PaaI family thioesterase n=1 Tax=Corynebacterium sp. Marseille-Q4381 TaxID=3121597 RepID=UPI002FE625C0